MTKTQRELLAKMRTGRTVTVHNDDPRVILNSRDRHPAGAERLGRSGVQWRTLVAMLRAGAVRVTDSSEHHVTYEAVPAA